MQSHGTTFQNPMNSSLFVTGATGLLGSVLVPLAVQRGYSVTALAHTTPGSFDQCVNIAADLAQFHSITALLNTSQPSVLIHAAALTDVDYCQIHQNETYRLHVEATANLADWAAQHHARFIHISTDSVFDGTKGDYAEEDTPGPVNYYAQTKWEGERTVQAKLPDAIIVRANFFGWSPRKKLGLAEWMLQSLINKKTISTFTDVCFSPLFTADLANLILDLTESNTSGIFHLASKDQVSKHEFAQQLSDIFGLPARLSPISIDQFAFKAPRPKNTSLCVVKISSHLRRTMPSVREGLLAFKTAAKGKF
jgi:dTDP-4-dehydrorhamnose reductase